MVVKSGCGCEEVGVVVKSGCGCEENGNGL